MKICVPCDDGSDRNCCQTVDITLPYKNTVLGACDVDVDESERTVRITANQAWIDMNKAYLDVDSIECFKDNGYFELNYADFGSTICGPCGSDNTYDSDGNNISHI